MKTTLQTVPVKDIKLKDGLQARQKFTDKDLEPLKLSIERKGILVPLVLQPNGKGYELVAGHRRFRCAQLLKLDQIPATVREGGDELEVTAIENMQRQQLTPVEEGRAVKALVDAGYTEKGAADALSITEAKVRDRLQLVAAPRAVQDAASWATARQLRVLLSMADASEKLGTRVAEYLADSDDEDRRALVDEPSWLIQQAVQGDRKKLGVWPISLTYDPGTIPGLKAELVKEANDKLSTQWWPYKVHLNTQEATDHAEALGAMWSTPFPPEYGDAECAIIGNDAAAEVARAQIERDLAKKKGEKKPTSTSSSSAKGDLSAAEQKDREKKRKEREAAYEAQIAARGLNLELGANLVKELAVKKFDKDAAELLAYLILSDHSGGMSDLAHAGLRIVFGDWQEDQTKTLKSGKRGRVKIGYLDRAEAEKKAWAWFDQAKTADQVLGRLLVILAAGQYGLAEALPSSQQWETSARRPFNRSFPGDRDKRALAALERIVKPALTAGYTKFVNAQKRRRSR